MRRRHLYARANFGIVTVPHAGTGFGGRDFVEAGRFPYGDLETYPDLENLGYEIESVPKKGYILRSAPDLLSPEEIVTHLHTEWVGHHIHYMKTTNSTNEVGKNWLPMAAPTA